MAFLVVIPIQGEFDWFIHGCAKHGITSTTALTGRIPAAYLPALDCFVTLGGLGKTQFAVQTQHLLDQLDDIEMVFCAGAAGAISPDLAIGDVVIGTETVEHDINNHFGKPLLPRFPGDPITVTAFQRLRLDRSFRLHFGPIASGDEDVVDIARGQALQRRTGALAVAWEGAGGARACKFSRMPFVEIRGITDNADHTAPSDFGENLPVVMANVARMIVDWASIGAA